MHINIDNFFNNSLIEKLQKEKEYQLYLDTSLDVNSCEVFMSFDEESVFRILLLITKEGNKEVKSLHKFNNFAELVAWVKGHDLSPHVW